jgi:hypothetical protein
MEVDVAAALLKLEDWSRRLLKNLDYLSQMTNDDPAWPNRL